MENRDFSESHWSAATAATVAYTIYHKIRLDTQATETKIKTTEASRIEEQLLHVFSWWTTVMWSP